MVDLGYLKQLLELSEAHNITHIKMAGLELAFKPLKKALIPEAKLEAPPLAEPLPEMGEFTGDDLMNYDKVLNWSGSPEPDMDIPLTGEEAL